MRRGDGMAMMASGGRLVGSGRVTSTTLRSPSSKERQIVELEVPEAVEDQCRW